MAEQYLNPLVVDNTVVNPAVVNFYAESEPIVSSAYVRGGSPMIEMGMGGTCRLVTLTNHFGFSPYFFPNGTSEWITGT